MRQAPIYQYKERRNRPDLQATSQLSPYLRFGHISAQAACLAARRAIHDAPSADAAKSAGVWLDELTWREFYINILHHFPHVRSRSFRPEYDAICWRNNRSEFDAWCKGETGYPLVDAAMRQLCEDGWMHNRTRMVVASFLVKDLLVDWRWGEKWFMQQLVDGDPAANNGGWQLTAGTGTDAAPYFRVFNPTMQAAKFDPEGDFIRAWLPELANVPTKHIHEPWKMSTALQEKVGCRVGRDYPTPIVDHHEARQRTLEAYQAAKEASKAHE
jgi:deoxyribodipyrimidine photo-lyase